MTSGGDETKKKKCTKFLPNYVSKVRSAIRVNFPNASDISLKDETTRILTDQRKLKVFGIKENRVFIAETPCCDMSQEELDCVGKIFLSEFSKRKSPFDCFEVTAMAVSQKKDEENVFVQFRVRTWVDVPQIYLDTFVTLDPQN